ncbi:EI24 domain-containing protein [Actinoplanes flavus]|uniref:EI24 domain-containing protein n=1 Tax=Actinoplanes flavus TaxID=2820290 RepID=A0ABS3URP5_9ACTN|nr:EI24 domain-containing protein [Actinoplanes flavus]MBO3740598.1 EI24 domain-containing protein [Actinoplanes flavus]
MSGDQKRPATALREFFTGAGLLGRGLGLVLGSPRLFLIGLIPALISGVLYTTAMVLLLRFLPDLSAQVTWFADDWSGWLRGTFRVLGGTAVLGLSVLLGVLTFTAVTLLIGDPFYEKISELVEDRFGGVPEAVNLGFWESLRRSLVDSLKLIGISILVGIPLFLLGFLPFVGQTVIPVLAGGVGGWLLALELTGVPFQRRGQRLRHRRLVLGRHRALGLGFGSAVFACFLIPLGAVLVMPAAIAGATLLARRSLGKPIEITSTASL